MMQERKQHGGYWYVQQQDGSWKRAEPVGQMPADPSYPYEGDKAREEARGAGLRNQGQAIDNRVAGATSNAEIRKAEAEARIAEAEAAQAASGADRVSESNRAAALKGWNDTLLLDQAIRELEKAYRDGPGSTSGIAGIRDYFGSPANSEFNDAGNSVRALVKGVLQFTGQENNTPRESEMNFGPYIPQSGDWDSSIEAKIDRLKRIRDNGRERAIQMLGGIPDEQGNVTPLDPRNAMTEFRTTGGAGSEVQANQGGDTRAIPYPPEMIAEHDAMVARMVAENGNRLDPRAYAEGKAELARKFGYPGSDAASDAAWAEQINEYIEGGGRTIPTGIRPQEEAMSAIDQARNAAAQNPLGAGLIGVGNGLGMGVIDRFAPDQINALRQEGGSTGAGLLAGEIGGAVGSIAGISGAGRALASRFAPQLLQGGRAAQVGRSLAADASYGGGYGSVTGEDPLASAGLATVGSLGGQALGGAARRLVGGATQDAAAQSLSARGIPLTTGQRMGGMAKVAEDKMTSIPVVGDMVRARRLDGMEAFNREAFEQAGAPIGFSPSRLGREGVEDFQGAVGSAYDDATAGVAAPLDNQFLSDLQDVAELGKFLPKDRRRDLANVLDARIQPIADAGQLTGSQYQSAMRALKKMRNKPPSALDGYEEEFRESVTATMNALEGQMLRAGGEGVVEGLGRANAANRAMKMLENASERAKGGSGSGESYIFTPSQLQMSATQAQKRFPGDKALLDLADEGQAVLPSTIPNSGTADRAMQLAVPALGAGATGGGVGYLADGQEGAQTGAMTGLGLAGLLALGGTRGGQRAINTALFERPQGAINIAEHMRRKRGLFGSAMVPIALTAQQ